MPRMKLKFPAFFLVLACMIDLTAGCLSSGGRLVPTISPDVKQIPKTIGFYPMLSSPVGRRGGKIRVMSSAIDKEVYIVPPTDSKLSVTSFSRMMTDLISKDLLYYGFDLRELPVEIPDDGSGDDDNDKTFAISLELLKYLQENYSVQAILMGNAYFSGGHATSYVEVHFAHLKLVDIKTLKVLCQIDMTYSDYGLDIDVVAEAMAEELALMAGLATEE